MITCSNSNKINEVVENKLNVSPNNFIEKSSVVPKKFKIKIIPSEALKDKKQRKAHKILKKCEIKSGIIYYVSKKPSPGKFKITTIPAFAKLSINDLKFFKSFKEESLFDSVNIELIQYITSNHPGSPCFDLIINHVKDNKLHLGPLTLCGKNEKHKNDWIDAISKFKHCKLDAQSDGKTLVEFNKVNELNKKSALTKLYYDQNNRAITTTTYGKDINSSYMKTLSDITNSIRTAKSQQNKIRRIMSGRLRRQRITTSQIIKKERTIRHNIDRHIRHAGTKEEKMIKLVNKEKELRVLSNLKNEILKIKVYFLIKIER